MITEVSIERLGPIIQHIVEAYFGEAKRALMLEWSKEIDEQISRQITIEMTKRNEELISTLQKLLAMFIAPH